MLRRIRPHLTYANVAATIALIGVLGGGTAYAANTVFSGDIVDGQVKTVDLANGAVLTDKLADGAVTSRKVNNNNLTGGDVAANSLKGTDIDESSLIGQVDNCPVGMSMFAQSFCLDAAPRSGGALKNWYEAGNICAANGLRLPTVGEVYYAQFYDALGIHSAWTDSVDREGGGFGIINTAVRFGPAGDTNFGVVSIDGSKASLFCAASTSDLF
jgi:hypothetical protein